VSVPSIEQMRESQRLGALDRGLEQNSTGRLGEALGHAVEITQGLTCLTIAVVFHRYLQMGRMREAVFHLSLPQLQPTPAPTPTPTQPLSAPQAPA
jgi:hypothetical protein